MLYCAEIPGQPGYTPAPAFAKGSHVHVIGDACKVGNLRTVIWQAWKVAEKL